MVDSGIKVDSDALKHIGELEKKKYDYIILKIKNEKVVVAEVMKPGGTCKTELEEEGVDLKGVPPVWFDFSRTLHSMDVAFGVSYVHFTTREGLEKSKLAFVYWCTESAKIKDKMIYSSSKIPTSRKIKSVNHVFQCSDSDELSYKEIVEVVSKGDHTYKKCGGH